MCKFFNSYVESLHLGVCKLAKYVRNCVVSWKKFTQLTKFLHDHRSRRSRQISSLNIANININADLIFYVAINFYISNSNINSVQSIWPWRMSARGPLSQWIIGYISPKPSAACGLLFLADVLMALQADHIVFVSASIGMSMTHDMTRDASGLKIGTR